MSRWVETLNGAYFPKDIYEWLKTQGIDYGLKQYHDIGKVISDSGEVGGDKTNRSGSSSDSGTKPTS